MDFFALLGRMKYIERWSLMHSTVKESIMEHSEQVAQIAHGLALISSKIFHRETDRMKVLVWAVFHETSEVLTGDLPTPVKYANKELCTAYKGLEDKANEALLETVEEPLRAAYREAMFPDKESYEYKLVKAADKLAAYLKCVEELKFGNREFQKAHETILTELKNSPLPEVDYFLKHYADSFAKNLDDLLFF